MKSKDIVRFNDKNCIDCGACKEVCPMMNLFETSSKNILKDLKRWDDKGVKYAYSCMLCDSCTDKCPNDLDLKEMFYELRKETYKFDIAKRKQYGMNTVKMHQKSSFSKLFSSDRIEYSTNKVFIPGCSLSSYSSDIVFKTFDYLKMNLRNIDILIKCCGKPTLDIGNEEMFDIYMSDLNDFLKQNNIKEVIVACENCYKTFKQNLQGIEVRSLWNVIAEVGIPSHLRRTYKNRTEEFALHDPCPIKQEAEIHQSVRKILNDLGLTIKEFEKNKDQTECCGCGGMIGVTNKELYTKQKEQRVAQTNCEYIISYCQSCIETFNSSGKKSIHILDLLFNDEILTGKKTCQETNNTIIKFINRVKVARKAQKERK